MTIVDVIGWLAAALTLLTFLMSSMVPLRLVALAANAAFILYGALTGIYPVVALHTLLIPCNLWRLRQLLQTRGGMQDLDWRPRTRRLGRRPEPTNAAAPCSGAVALPGAALGPLAAPAGREAKAVGRDWLLLRAVPRADCAGGRAWAPGSRGASGLGSAMAGTADTGCPHAGGRTWSS